ncbi:PEP-CTERM sorting domain-containing protein [Azohydromonas caseinilytica]|uniref:PEP-CTERM sorting domain-containing protein n=1 Tax=Azohydromonas caseinilytica TaxID=2728836 RepID=A0A848F7R4_9BURK|nr:PEP-CTERM sorting domain-containing protein [Azohydromonas caseinilytica]NML16147.1 PEP-CTERM sorting domain-containing protein [Azohydromonas caseinilytica]
MKKLLSALLLTVCGVTAAQARITYTYEQAPNDASGCTVPGCYKDPYMTKLTDGRTGYAGVLVDQARPWVGWYNLGVVNIDFNLGAVTPVSSVSIGSAQNRLDDVVLPSFAVYALEGSEWVLKGTLDNPPTDGNNRDEASKASHPIFTLSDLDIQSQFVRVSVMSNGPWSFLDEVYFNGQRNPVPEPGSAAMVLAGLGCLGLISRRRRNR